MKDDAYLFLKKIKSSWKGYEDFAIWLVEEMRPEVTVDLGFDVGLSTCAFALPGIGKVYGIDWFDEVNFSEKTKALDAAHKNLAEISQKRNLKNIHIIIGSYLEVAKNWKEPIDILHIDWVFSYDLIKTVYQNWSKFLREKGVILIHDIEKNGATIGKFFASLSLPKLGFTQNNGLGVITKDEALLKKIHKRWKRNC